MKDYFQDIVPPRGGDRRSRRPAAPEPEQLSDQENEVTRPEEEMSDDTLPVPAPDRSIRNVHIQSSRPRRTVEMPVAMARPARKRRRWLLWILALVTILVCAVLALIAFRPTRVTVTPRTHAISFDNTNRYTAYPSASAPAGALAYSVKIITLQESEVVASTGSTHVEDKASGQITVFNSYSSDPVKLVKNTRFATPDGHVFRAPVDIMVPGKSGSAPGKITITVIADAAGEEYNIGPFNRLTLPGLQSTPDMYANVYAQSSVAFSGGFSGDKPGVSAADQERAVAAMRSRLESKARESIAALETDGDVVFADLARITYAEDPSTPESGNMVRLRQKANISVPVFPAAAFAQAVALSVSVDAANAPIEIVPGQGYGAQLVSPATSTLGVDPIQFGLLGQAELLWQVDAPGLASALAGRDQSAFQTIVTTFPSIQEARARIQPFWATTFPSDPSKIDIVVTAGDR